MRGLSVLPQRGLFDALHVGLEHSSMVSLQIKALLGLNGHFVVVAELEGEVDRSAAVAHNSSVRLHCPVLPS